MALFKISKGMSQNLPVDKTAGCCWYTFDDSMFYIDYEDENGVIQRKPLNAKSAEDLSGSSLSEILRNTHLEIPTSKAVLDAISNVVRVSDTEPTDDGVKIWINFSEEEGEGGDVVPSAAVLYNEQTLTDAQKDQARSNIGAASKEDLDKLSSEKAVVYNAVGTTYPPSQKPAASEFEGYDIDLYNSKADEVYAYIDNIVSGKSTVTKEILGKDASGKYDLVRYIHAQREHLAWVKDKYPKMYAWKNGSAIKYTKSVSPRIGDKAYDVPYVQMVTSGGTSSVVTTPAQAVIYPNYRFSMSGGGWVDATSEGLAAVIIPLPVGGVTSATIQLTNTRRHHQKTAMYGGATPEEYTIEIVKQASGMWSADATTCTMTTSNSNLAGASFMVFNIVYTDDASLSNVVIMLDGKTIDWVIGTPSEAKQETTTTVTGGLVPTFTNLKDQCVFVYNSRFSLSGGGYKTVNGISTILIPVPVGETDITIRLKGFSPTTYSMIYGGTSTETLSLEFGKFSSDSSVPDSDGVYVISGTKTSDIAYLSFHAWGSGAADFADTVITVNEPIEYTVDTSGSGNTIEVEGGMPVTAVSATNRSRTIDGVVYTRYESGDVNPTVIYTDIDDDRNSENTITKDGVTYHRYPLGDLGSNRKKLIPIFIYANEHGVNPNDLYFSSESPMCSLVLARFFMDIVSDKQIKNPLYKFIRESCMLIVIPVANPYGFNMYITGDTNASNDGYRNANNVNINRNYDTPGWDVTKANESYWAGSYAGSEIEAQYIMNTMVEGCAKVAMSWHSAEWWWNSHQGQNPNPNATGEADKYVDYNRDKLGKIETFIKNNYGYNQRYYDLYTQAHVDAGIVSSDMIGKPYPCKNTPDVTSKSPSYISQCGAYGGIVEFSPGDITVGGTITHRMSERTLENAYAFVMNLTAMWLSDYLESTGS